MFEEGGKLWFCTSNQKEIYRKLQNQSVKLIYFTQGGPEGTAELFRKTHDYFTDALGLSNLVWVWAELVKETNTTEEIQAIYDNPRVITLDQMPGWK